MKSKKRLKSRLIKRPSFAHYFKVGQRVKLKMPLMTKPRISKTGMIVNIDGAYIAVHPSRWPKGTFIEFYPNEISPFKKDMPHA